MASLVPATSSATTISAGPQLNPHHTLGKTALISGCSGQPQATNNLTHFRPSYTPHHNTKPPHTFSSMSTIMKPSSTHMASYCRPQPNCLPRLSQAPTNVRHARVITRAAEETQTSEALSSTPQLAAVTPEPVSVRTPSVAAEFNILNTTNEAINGRAAMLGFVVAVVAEELTHHSVWSQLTGKIVNQEFVERAIGASDVGFWAVVALVTLGTLAPRLLEQKGVDSRSFGPFTPAAEKLVGRVAMLGFSGLLVVEAIKGSSLL